jgi:hypothetical protein
MSPRLALGLALLAFLATLLARLPARAVTALLPATVVCEQPQGTVWHGACAQVRSGAVAIDDLGWNVHPLALLQLRLSADVSSGDPRIAGQAHVELGRDGTLEVRTLEAQLPLQGGLNLFPPGFQGTVQVDVATLRLVHGELGELVGTLRALQLRSDSFGELGSFELRFPPASATAVPAADITGGAAADSAIVGQLRDLSGPLSLQGQLMLTRRFGYELTGTLLARASASTQLTQALQLLGAPDSEGRRSFSLAGTL